MNITTIVTQMTILLFIMIIGFVGAKKNIFNDEVNVYASNILLRIGIPGLIISSVKDGSPFTGNELFNVLVIFSIFVIFTGIVSKIIVEVLRIKENKALWQFMILFTNAGFMGLPAIQAILGDKAMLYGALFLLPLNCLMYGYGESLFRKGGFSFKKFMNGPMIASVVALILCILNIKLPYILGQTCTYVGNVTTPLSMMVIGAGLVKMDIKEL
ncbi:AEC family transporter, partial [uncultured Holdemanella sp.]